MLESSFSRGRGAAAAAFLAFWLKGHDHTSGEFGTTEHTILTWKGSWGIETSILVGRGFGMRNVAVPIGVGLEQTISLEHLCAPALVGIHQVCTRCNRRQYLAREGQAEALNPGHWKFSAWKRCADGERHLPCECTQGPHQFFCLKLDATARLWEDQGSWLAHIAGGRYRINAEVCCSRLCVEGKPAEAFGINEDVGTDATIPMAAGRAL